MTWLWCEISIETRQLHEIFTTSRYESFRQSKIVIFNLCRNFFDFCHRTCWTLRELQRSSLTFSFVTNFYSWNVYVIQTNICASLTTILCNHVQIRQWKRLNFEFDSFLVHQSNHRRSNRCVENERDFSIARVCNSKNKISNDDNDSILIKT